MKDRKDSENRVCFVCYQGDLRRKTLKNGVKTHKKALSYQPSAFSPLTADSCPLKASTSLPPCGGGGFGAYQAEIRFT